MTSDDCRVENLSAMQNWRVALVLAVAATGIGLSLSNGTENFASVFEPSVDGSTRPSTAVLPLSQQLAALHDAIVIRPEQEPAWKRFAGQMTELEALTRTYERWVASGLSLNTEKERARHALIFGAAMNDVDATLSSEQTVRLHRLARDLAGSSICRTLAN